MNDRNERNRHGRFGRDSNEERFGQGRGRDEERWQGQRREGQFSSDYDETLGSEWERDREPNYDQGGYGSYGRGGYGGDPGYGRGGGQSYDESRRGRGYQSGHAGMYGGGSGAGYTGGRSSGGYGGSTGTEYGSGGSYGSGSSGHERGFSGGRDQGYRGRDFGSPGANSRSGSYAGGYGFNEGAGSSGFGRSEGQQRGGFAGRGPKGYTRTDERIREEVCERLSRDDDVDASEIEVQVKDGEVTLSGTVQTRSMKHTAENLAEDVHGVSDVTNQLRVIKSMMNELKDKLTGKDDETHYANTGTKNGPASSTVGRNGTL